MDKSAVDSAMEGTNVQLLANFYVTDNLTYLPIGLFTPLIQATNLPYW